MAMAVVNGGEIRGRMIAPSKKKVQPLDRLARTAVKAKRKPRTVPKKPTRAASSRLFQSAWRWFGSPRILKTFTRLKLPPSSKVRRRSLVRGKRIKSARKAQKITRLTRRAGSRRTFWKRPLGLGVTAEAGIFQGSRIKGV